ncbi:WD40 repeat domain-containing protein [Sulfurovum sp. bin170]|uniref:WD40 repeat domain-containing protein n=1 Tax=Sulfurovum sp. bin170 TaxID=2695268 RepID=UPI0013DEA3AE|nr:WD40 repeat domain-containing protein [Sulfurovum sp. bin170]NEW59679.1 WD40 repeat domain-containing protein [Sulfurovum sp. bin170]
MRLLIIFLLFIQLNAKDLKPSFVYEGSGGVTDLVYKDAKLYSATVEGAVDIYDTKEQKLIKTIKVPNIKDFAGDDVASKVYSVDIVDGKIMIASQGKMGYRRVHIYADDNLTEVISVAKSYTIAKAKFIDRDTLLIAMLSNELILYDIKNSKQLYREQITASKFSNFALNENKDEVLLVDESGELRLIGVKDGKVLKEFKGQNVDNVFQVDYKNGMMITAGQDRRCAVYSKDGRKAYYKDGSFLIYSTGLSPSGEIGGFAADEHNNVILFNTSSKSDLYKLGSHKATISNILFINEEELFTASDDNHINYWEL